MWSSTTRRLGLHKTHQTTLCEDGPPKRRLQGRKRRESPMFPASKSEARFLPVDQWRGGLWSAMTAPLRRDMAPPRRRQCRNLYRSSSRLSPTPWQVTHRNSSPPTHRESCNSPQRTWHSHRRAIRCDESLPAMPATEKPSRDAYICAITEQF